jgi:drug/metabolite transporter (DMT)-like permease
VRALNKRALRADLILLLTACIWGFAFVAQRAGMDHLGPFTYNGIRFLMGSLSLVPLILVRRGLSRGEGATILAPVATVKTVILSSFAAGACLFIGVSFQQLGIMITTVGNSGFITGLYVVLTPIFGIFLGRKTGIPTWVGATLSVGGMFCISLAGQANGVNIGDVLTAIAAVFWAIHVLLIDYLVRKVDPIVLSSGQFAFCGALSSGAAFFMRETLTCEALIGGSIPILYGGLCSVGVAYTLQVVAQKDAPPAHASILLSFEGVFAVIGGILLLSEPLGARTLLGFALMFAGMLATQWDVIAGGRRKAA